MVIEMSNINSEILYEKVVSGKSCRALAGKYKVGKSTIGNRTFGHNNKYSLANAVARDYVKPHRDKAAGKRVRTLPMTERQQREVSDWLQANILELTKMDGFLSVGQTNYRTRSETGRVDLTEWVDWYTGDDNPETELSDWCEYALAHLAYFVNTYAIIIDGLALDSYQLPYLFPFVNTLVNGLDNCLEKVRDMNNGEATGTRISS